MRSEIYKRLSAFTMDPVDGYLLFATHPCRGSGPAQLLRANLDGSDARVLVTASAAFPMEYVVKITIDYQVSIDLSSRSPFFLHRSPTESVVKITIDYQITIDHH